MKDRVVLAVVNSRPKLERVWSALHDEGIDDDDIGLIARSDNPTSLSRQQEDGGLLDALDVSILAVPQYASVITTGPLEDALVHEHAGEHPDGVVAALEYIGVPRAEAERYARQVLSGGILVGTFTDDEHALQVQDLLSRYEDGATADARNPRGAPLQTEARDSALRSSGAPAPRGTDNGEETIPIIEEELQVGKRAAESGVRVFSRVVEQPKEQKVKLRDERVIIERQPVNRPATERDLHTHQNDAIELTEHHEEPVVGVERRVTEEVRVGKTIDTREETVRGTERHTEVEVERNGEVQRSPSRNGRAVTPRAKNPKRSV